MYRIAYWKIVQLDKKKKSYREELLKIKNSTIYANKIGLEVHAGHGMDYKTTEVLSKIKGIREFNIGHFIIGESIFVGIKKVILNIKKLMKK